MSHNCYLVYTKPKHESVAFLNLQQLGSHAYFPLYKNFKNSALMGIQGLVKSVSSKRVAVLLELLGQDQLVHVDNNQLQPA